MKYKLIERRKHPPPPTTKTDYKLKLPRKASQFHNQLKKKYLIPIRVHYLAASTEGKKKMKERKKTTILKF